MSVLLCLIAGAAALAYFWVQKRFNYWKDRGFVSVDSTFPFGSLKGAGTELNIAGLNERIYKKYKGKAPGVGALFFLSPTFVVLEPEVLKNILVRDFSSFHDRGFYYNKEADPVSANILSLEGQEWRDRRVKLSPIFTSGKMKTMFDIVDDIGERLIRVIDNDMKTSNVLEMRVLAMKYTSDVIGNVAFGLDCRCLEDPKSEFFKQGRRLFDLSSFEFMKAFFTLAFPGVGRKLGLRAFPKEATEFFRKTFIQTLKHRDENKIKRNDFVSLLLGLKDHFTTEELAAESFLIYAGGYETSSTLMQFTMYELALNLDIQERLRSEISSATFETDGKVTYDSLHSMQYLDMVMNESLRKYPPIPNLVRKSVKEYTIPGTKLTLEKGTAIEIPTYSLHHDPEYYPEPQKFDPERFTPENVKARDPFTYLPFGEGPRNCIGLRFGLMQTKFAIVKLLQHYEISPSDKTPIPMKFQPSSPFLAPLGGLQLKLRKLE